MQCNEFLKCSVEKQYLGFINTTSSFKLSRHSYINFKDHIKSASRYHYKRKRIHNHVAHVELLDYKGKIKRPFTTYYLAYSGSHVDQTSDLTSNEKYQFLNYKKNPKLGFYLEINRSEHFILIFTLIFSALVFTIYYIANFFENLFKKNK